MTNQSDWFPVEFNCVVLPDPVKEKTKGGIYLPDDTKNRDQHAATAGTLIAVSPLAFSYEIWPEGSRRPEVGDKILFAKYAGSLVDVDKPDGYRIIKDKDILAIGASK